MLREPSDQNLTDHSRLRTSGRLENSHRPSIGHAPAAPATAPSQDTGRGFGGLVFPIASGAPHPCGFVTCVTHNEGPLALVRAGTREEVAMKAAQTTISRTPLASDDIPVTPALLDEALVLRIAEGDQLAMRTLYGAASRPGLSLYSANDQKRPQRPKISSATYFSMSGVTPDVSRAGAWWRPGCSRSRVTKHSQLCARSARTSWTRTWPTPSPDSADSPETAIVKKDRGAALRECLTRLSPEHREIITLVYYHERSVEEVSDIVGIPRSTVKTRMFYAARSWRSCWRRRGIAGRRRLPRSS